MPSSDYTPDVDQVGALLRARTKDANGNEAGTFTDDTRPTEDGAASTIAIAVNQVATRIGKTIPDDEELRAQASALVALRAALLIELTYFPEQIGSNQSPYTQLKALYDEELPLMVQALADYDADPTTGIVGEGMPSYAFPADAGGMVGWGTRW